MVGDGKSSRDFQERDNHFAWLVYLGRFRGGMATRSMVSTAADHCWYTMKAIVKHQLGLPLSDKRMHLPLLLYSCLTCPKRNIGKKHNNKKKNKKKKKKKQKQKKKKKKRKRKRKKKKKKKKTRRKKKRRKKRKKRRKKKKRKKRKKRRKKK